MKTMTVVRAAGLVAPLALCLTGCAAPARIDSPGDGSAGPSPRFEYASPRAPALRSPPPLPQDHLPVADTDPNATADAQLSGFDNFHTIAAGRAYRSAQLSPEKLKRACREHGITTVINLRGPNPKHEWYRAQQAACAEIGVTLIDIAWSANHLPPRHKLLAFYDALENQHGPLLLHCSAGADRTGAAAAIYRMQVLREDRAAASRELSLRFGHIRLATPKMDELVEMYQPRREWIEKEYPAPE